MKPKLNTIKCAVPKGLYCTNEYIDELEETVIEVLEKRSIKLNKSERRKNYFFSSTGEQPKIWKNKPMMTAN